MESLEPGDQYYTMANCRHILRGTASEILTWDLFQCKDHDSQYRIPLINITWLWDHCVYNGNSYTIKMASLFWNGAQGTETMSLNPQHAEFNVNYFEINKCVLSTPLLHIEDEDLPILHSPYHDCWWPGDTRSQGISCHGTDLIFPEYASLSTERVKRAHQHGNSLTSS